MPLGGVIFISIFILIFGIVMVFIASKLGRIRDPNPVKMEIYECGIPELEKKDTKISVKFYLTAILFILFDIEIIFMYPWATSFREFIADGTGLYALVAMLVFIAIFLYGLFWEVKSKALEWD
ncbi:MAG: NADH-quinone oxidoreductase subunit A [Bdellovibrionia bacterium]